MRKRIYYNYTIGIGTVLTVCLFILLLKQIKPGQERQRSQVHIFSPKTLHKDTSLSFAFAIIPPSIGPGIPVEFSEVTAHSGLFHFGVVLRYVINEFK